MKEITSIPVLLMVLLLLSFRYSGPQENPRDPGFLNARKNAKLQTFISPENNDILGSIVAPGDSDYFNNLLNLDWEEKLYDPCIDGWKENWFLDGVKGKVINGPEGMDLYAGPDTDNDSSHVVLWTKESFSGNVKVEYNFTRLDNATKFVNIIYIQAEGSGQGVYDRDISKWSELRTVPSMSLYFNNMNTYHISYAAFMNSNTDYQDDYIRARRYLPEQGGRLKGTELLPDYFKTRLFEKDIPYRVTIIKHGRDLFMQIENPEKKMLCHWKNESFPDILQGRIGLRHMGSRISRYSDFRVSTCKF